MPDSPLLSRLCTECEQRPVSCKGLCNACYKRLVWRPAGGEAVENDRAASRKYKARNRPALRVYDAAYFADPSTRAACANCGGRLAYSKECRLAEGAVCMACRHSARHERALRIVAMWARGMRIVEIATELGWAKGTLGAEINWMRRNGYDIPYRHKVKSREEVAA